MNITRTSIITKTEHALDPLVTPEQIAAFEAGALFRNTFPNLSAPERGFILTGITPAEGGQFLGSPEDEPAEDRP
jgi:hypothetical protein